MAELIGHRGFSAVYPENTILSFKKAIEVGCDGIELDVRLTKDGKVVVFHDKDLIRTAHTKGFVSDYTLRELKRITVVSEERIPSLADVFKEIKGVKFLVEIKTDYEKDIEKLCLETVKIAKGVEDVWFISFSADVAKHIKKIDQSLMTGLIFSRPLVNPDRFSGFLNAICPRIDRVNRKLIDFAKAQGLMTYSWTMDTKKHYSIAKKFGINGIVSNNPLKIKEWI